ncbi:MAG: histidine kinase [Myxococcales bacterium]|nr:MAG: histidine kinase [Myxococcales bacterium]
MFRALAVLRVIVLVNAVGLYAFRFDAYERPAAGWVVMGLLTLWTGWVIWASHRERTRHTWVYVVDLLVAVAAMGATEFVKGEGFRATLPGFWVSGAMLAWAIRWRSRGGLFAAVVIAVVDVVIRDFFSQTTYANIFLMVLGGQVVGFLSGQMQQMAVQRDEALLASAAAAERQRIARVVHDGVLQVLALVQRNGADLGPAGRELSVMAGQEEARLRALVQSQGAPPVVVGDLDLGQELSALATDAVQVSTPGRALGLPAPTVHELVAAVEACLSNVRHHVGRDAPAWVLVEDLDDRVLVSVRDNGPGIPEGRLEEAAGQGRLGVRESIGGRIHDLGGEATLHTGPTGTEWEFDVPKGPQ